MRAGNVGRKSGDLRVSQEGVFLGFVTPIHRHFVHRHSHRIYCPSLRSPTSATDYSHNMSAAPPHSGVHPVLTLINRCDELARSFDSTFESSCTLLTNLANGTPAPGQPTTMDDTLMSLRATLERCEEIVGAMLNCIYEDIPHLLDQLDSGAEGGVGNWNPKEALDGISQLFYVSHLSPFPMHSNSLAQQKALTFTRSPTRPRSHSHACSRSHARWHSHIKNCCWKSANC